MPEDATEDRRVARTRNALHQAFMDLVAERAYDEITVAEVIAAADVGRSTFYQHYSNKDDILRAVMAGGFEALADTVDGGDHVQHLEDWLGIFWDYRRGGRILLSGQTRVFISRQLADLIEARLPKGAAPVAPKLVAAMIAEAQLGLIHAWLTAHTAATPAGLAKTLRLAAQGLVVWLYDQRPD